MARERGPYSVLFPVNFTSKGDTTREAFRKHMDEITRIYGILTGLDADAIDAGTVSSMLQAHIDSATPHPNYKPSWTDLKDKPGLDDLSGTLTASKVRGALTGATIASGNVTGLEAFVNGKLPEDKGIGITDAEMGDSGYVKFKSGFMIQWGRTVNQYEFVHPSIENEHSFQKEFTSACFAVVTQPWRDDNVQTVLEAFAVITKQTKTGFKFIHELVPGGAGGGTGPWYLRYIAIGI